METLHYGEHTVEYRIIRSKRRTVSIEVGVGGVCVRVPNSMRKHSIQSLVDSKAEWILSKSLEMKEKQRAVLQHNYQTGDIFLYRGEHVQLFLQNRKEYRDTVHIEGERLIVSANDLSEESIRSLLEAWYRMEAKARFEERVAYYVEQYGVTGPIGRITIKDQKSRWGSCSSKHNLNFNYRLMMAPDQVLDYVVVHELCHLKYMNHSSAFWKEVEYMMPNYRAMMDWLKRNGCKLKL